MNCKYCQNESCVMAGIPNEVPSKCPGAVATNADRIRAMTNEEMAEFLARFADTGYWNHKEWYDWLKEEATE